MFCQKCGAEMAAPGRPCAKCGYQRRGFGWFVGKGILLTLVALGVLVVIAAIAVLGSTATKNSGGPGQSPSWVTRTERLGSSAFTLAPGQYEYVEFTVAPGTEDAVVIGHFVASGGGGNDVKVYVLTGDGFVNWTNHHAFREYYDSGQTTTGSLDVGPLPAGHYYLVYSNRFSVISNKAVESSIRLSYAAY